MEIKVEPEKIAELIIKTKNFLIEYQNTLNIKNSIKNNSFLLLKDKYYGLEEKFYNLINKEFEWLELIEDLSKDPETTEITLTIRKVVIDKLIIFDEGTINPLNKKYFYKEKFVLDAERLLITCDDYYKDVRKKHSYFKTLIINSAINSTKEWIYELNKEVE